MRQVLATTKNESMGSRMLQFVRSAPCPVCHGTGLRAAALAVSFAGLSIPELNALPVAELSTLLRTQAAADPDGVAGQTLIFQPDPR